MSKNVVETEGPQMTSQYGAYALHAGLARLHARMRMHTPTRTHAHTDQYVILVLLFHGNSDSRKRLIVTLDTIWGILLCEQFVDWERCVQFMCWLENVTA
jgi:hypothetical protein